MPRPLTRGAATPADPHAPPQDLRRRGWRLPHMHATRPPPVTPQVSASSAQQQQDAQEGESAETVFHGWLQRQYQASQERLLALLQSRAPAPVQASAPPAPRHPGKPGAWQAAGGCLKTCCSMTACVAGAGLQMLQHWQCRHRPFQGAWPSHQQDSWCSEHPRREEDHASHYTWPAANPWLLPLPCRWLPWQPSWNSCAARRSAASARPCLGACCAPCSPAQPLGPRCAAGAVRVRLGAGAPLAAGTQRRCVVPLDPAFAQRTSLPAAPGMLPPRPTPWRAAPRDSRPAAVQAFALLFTKHLQHADVRFHALIVACKLAQQHAVRASSGSSTRGAGHEVGPRDAPASCPTLLVTPCCSFPALAPTGPGVVHTGCASSQGNSLKLRQGWSSPGPPPHPGSPPPPLGAGGRG